MTPPAGKIILIAGASSDSGRAVGRALMDAGARVIAVGSNLARLAVIPAEARYECNLSSLEDVTALAARIHSELGPIDGLIHLVGGWRSGRGDEDWRWLESRVVITLRNTTNVFRDDLAASDAGRLAIVSSASVDTPTWGGANYATAKAAAETWARAAASGFAKAGTAASVIFVVSSLGEGGTPVEKLAREVVALWSVPASKLNGIRINLETAP